MNSVVVADPPPGILTPEIERLMRVRNHPWAFAETCVFTLDEADKYHPIKPYPTDKEYLKWIVERILREPLVAFVKHRRMILTWTCCMVGLWDAMFHEGRKIGFQSKKEEDSDDLVRRCKFIYDNIPEDVLLVKPVAQYKYTELTFPEIDSVIKGFPQATMQHNVVVDPMRQHTLSRIFADEIAFWPNARASFVGMKPTLEGGGQLTLLSTRYPGFFKELIEDTFDNA